MRDKEYIAHILKELQHIWEVYPDKRLGQLLLSHVDATCLGYIDDEVLIHKMKTEIYSNLMKEHKDGET